MEETATAAPSGDMEDLGLDSSLLYESFTDAVAHCAAGAYLAARAFLQVGFRCTALVHALRCGWCQSLYNAGLVHRLTM